MYTLSVIIPVYNTEAYLADCLDSLLIRNSFEGEIICINDGSTDGSLQVLQNYAKRYSNIRIISQENQRQGAARNEGIKVAKCDYILMVDSDDMIAEGSIQRILTQIDGEDLIYFMSCNYDQAQKNTSNYFGRRVALKMNGKEYFEHILDLNDYTNISPIALYRRTFLQKNSILFIPKVYHEDHAWAINIFFFAQSVTSLNEPVYIYRIREGSTMHSISPAHCQDRLTVANKIIDFCRRNNWFTLKIKKFVWNFDYWDAIEHSVTNGYNRQSFFTAKDWWRMWKCCSSRNERRITILALFNFNAATRYKNYQTPRFLRKFYNLIIR